MATSKNLTDRIDAEFSAADERIQQLRSDKIQSYEDRQQRVEQLSQTFDELRGIWGPRLETLAKKFGERVEVRPTVEPGKRSATFDVKSELAHINLRFAVAPDPDVQTLTFTYDLEIIPILMKFESHDAIEFPIDQIDKETLGNWFDDRIISFVRTYLAIHENQYYLKDHMVEDPVAKIRFPKYAAGATADVGGKTYYFIDESTRRQFQQK
jgi:YHS domain-containing protein